MTYNQNTLPTETSHHILLENRSRLAVSGVEEVEDGGDLKVEGSIDAISYEAPREKGGFFSRLLG